MTLCWERKHTKLFFFVELQNFTLSEQKWEQHGVFQVTPQWQNFSTSCKLRYSKTSWLFVFSKTLQSFCFLATKGELTQKRQQRSGTCKRRLSRSATSSRPLKLLQKNSNSSEANFVSVLSDLTSLESSLSRGSLCALLLVPITTVTLHSNLTVLDFVIPVFWKEIIFFPKRHSA